MSDGDIQSAQLTEGGAVITPTEGTFTTPEPAGPAPTAGTAEGDRFAEALALLAGKETEDAAPASAPVKRAPAVKSENVGEEPAAAPAPADPVFKSKFEQLAKDYSKFREQQEASRKEVEELRVKASKWEQARKNPGRIHEFLDMQQDEFTKGALEYDPTNPAMREVQSTKEELRQLREAFESQRREAEQATQQSRFSEFKSETAKWLNSHSDDFEYTHALGEEGVQHIVNTMLAAAKEGKEVSFAEAAKQIEDRLEDELTNRFIKTKKLSSKFGQKRDSDAPAKSKSAPRTLTSNLTAQTTGKRAATEEERLAAALKVLTLR